MPRIQQASKMTSLERSSKIRRLSTEYPVNTLQSMFIEDDVVGTVTNIVSKLTANLLTCGGRGCIYSLNSTEKWVLKIYSEEEKSDDELDGYKWGTKINIGPIIHSSMVLGKITALNRNKIEDAFFTKYPEMRRLDLGTNHSSQIDRILQYPILKCIVMERFDYDLQQFILEAKDGDHIKSVLKQLKPILTTMIKNNKICFDIKTQNFLIKADNFKLVVKATDLDNFYCNDTSIASDSDDESDSDSEDLTELNKTVHSLLLFMTLIEKNKVVCEVLADNFYTLYWSVDQTYLWHDLLKIIQSSVIATFNFIWYNLKYLTGSMQKNKFVLQVWLQTNTKKYNHDVQKMLKQISEAVLKWKIPQLLTKCPKCFKRYKSRRIRSE